jgi:hypothetical protein
LEGSNPPDFDSLKSVYPNLHSFRHTADQTDIIPPLTISGNPCSNVNSALIALAGIFNPSAPSPATTTTYGVIKLGGDLGGNNNAAAPMVSGIQGRPVSTQPPNPNQVLTWNGSQWIPMSNGTFFAGGDLTGTASLQRVIGLTGSSGVVNSSANTIQFVSAANILSPSNITIAAQGVSSQLNLDAGSDGVSLSTGSSVNVVQVTQIGTTPQTVAAFFPPPTGLTTTQMPANTGSNVIYIGDTLTPPTVPATSGSILWSFGGQLNVMQENGSSFALGSIPNPSVWGTQSATSGESITYRSYAVSSSTLGSAVQFTTSNPTFSLSILTNTAIRVDCIFVGKQVGSTNCAEYNLSLGFVVNGSGVVSTVGTVTNSDPRSNNPTEWNMPNISSSGGNLVVTTGYTTAGNANWTVITQIVLSPQG